MIVIETLDANSSFLQILAFLPKLDFFFKRQENLSYTFEIISDIFGREDQDCIDKSFKYSLDNIK